MTFAYTDPHALKQLVSVLHVLAHRGLATQLRRLGPRLVGPCPVHGGDNPHAFVVHPDKNVWYCFTRCQAGGDVIDLVRRLDRVSFPQALRALAELANTLPATGRVRPAPATPSPSFRPFTRALPLDPAAPLLRAKGIDLRTAVTFEAGAYTGNGFLRDCVAVRLHDLDGAPLGYAGRRLLPDDIRRQGKWKLPPALPKAHILYNFHRVRDALRTLGVALVEDPWSVMRLAQIGVPALALLGTSLSRVHCDLLAAAPRVVLMLDADPAGYAAVSRILPELQRVTTPLLASLPPGSDPDDLSDDALRALLLPLLP